MKCAFCNEFVAGSPKRIIRNNTGTNSAVLTRYDRPRAQRGFAIHLQEHCVSHNGSGQTRRGGMSSPHMSGCVSHLPAQRGQAGNPTSSFACLGSLVLDVGTCLIASCLIAWREMGTRSIHRYTHGRRPPRVILPLALESGFHRMMHELEDTLT